HDEVLHEGEAIRVECRLPTSLPHNHSTLDGLRVTQPFCKSRHVVGCRTIKRSHVEAAHEGDGLHELDRQEEGRRSQDAPDLETLRLRLSRRSLRWVTALIEAIHPEGETRRISFTIQEVVIVLPHECGVVIDRIRWQ